MSVTNKGAHSYSEGKIFRSAPVVERLDRRRILSNEMKFETQAIVHNGAPIFRRLL